MKQVYPKYEDGRAILIDEGSPVYLDKFTPYHLTNEKHRYRNMNSNTVEAWFKEYRGLRIDPETGMKLQPVRALVEQRKKDIAAAYREKKSGENLDIDIRNFTRELNGLLDYVTGDPKYSPAAVINRSATSKRNTLWDLPFVPLGYTSLAAIQQADTNSAFKPTAEHCFPRTVSVMNIIRWCLERKKIDSNWVLEHADVIRMAFPSCVVVWTTKKENESLKKWQKKNIFKGPTESYESAGIKVHRTGPVQIPFAWEWVAESYGVDLNECELPIFVDSLCS